MKVGKFELQSKIEKQVDLFRKKKWWIIKEKKKFIKLWFYKIMI